MVKGKEKFALWLTPECRQLFKLAVEQNVNNHILASDTDIDARSYQKMRGLSMDEVKRTNGRIDFEDALLVERGV